MLLLSGRLLNKLFHGVVFFLFKVKLDFSNHTMDRVGEKCKERHGTCTRLMLLLCAVISGYISIKNQIAACLSFSLVTSGFKEVEGR